MTTIEIILAVMVVIAIIAIVTILVLPGLALWVATLQRRKNPILMAPRRLRPYLAVTGLLTGFWVWTYVSDWWFDPQADTTPHIERWGERTRSEISEIAGDMWHEVFP